MPADVLAPNHARPPPDIVLIIGLGMYSLFPSYEDPLVTNDFIQIFVDQMTSCKMTDEISRNLMTPWVLIDGLMNT